MALYSCVYAYRRLTRPGMSVEVRYVFIRKHILYVGIFIFIWTFYLAHSYYSLYVTSLTDEEKAKDQYNNLATILSKISIYTALCTGFLLSCIRVREPYFKFLIRKKFLEWFGILMDEKSIHNSNQYINDSLATFLTSSLNVGLVHVILEAVTKYTVGRTDPHSNYLHYNEYYKSIFIIYSDKFKDTNKFSIDTIMIKDPEKWKVAKLPDFIMQNCDIMEHKTTVKKQIS